MPAASHAGVHEGIAALVRGGPACAARSANALMTPTSREIGQPIVEAEQQGKRRANHGDALVKRLAAELTAQTFSAATASRFPLPWSACVRMLSVGSDAAPWRPSCWSSVATSRCGSKGTALAHCVLEGLPNKVLAAEHKTALPDEEVLAAASDQTQPCW